MRPARAGRRARVSVTLLIVSILLGAGAGAGAYYLLGAFTPRTGSGDTASGPGREGEITALGRLEPAGGVLDVVGPPADRVLALGVLREEEIDARATEEPKAERPFKEGDEVRRGDVLAVLESWKDRQRGREVAQQQLDEEE